MKDEVIAWKKVEAIRAAHGWTWAEIARRMGIGESHFSEIRRGLRPPNLTFIRCLAMAVDLGWSDLLLPAPMLHAGMSARDVLGITDLEDGRPWPVQYSRASDQAMYRRWQREQDVNARVP